jgi:hypothetical protein
LESAQSFELFARRVGVVMTNTIQPVSEKNGHAPVLPINRANDTIQQDISRYRQQLQRQVVMERYSSNSREQQFQLIAQQVLGNSKYMRNPNFSSSSTSDLQLMAELYDQFFLGGNCLPLARCFGLQFRWSKRMTSNGGKTVRTIHSDRRSGTQRIHYEIVLSAPLLFQTFSDLQRPIRVTGLLCSNRLQALQRIMEHELIHLAEMLVWDHSCCASPRFQGIANRLFGHTEHKHDLITQHERAERKFNIRVGTRVSFRFEGTSYVGTVNRITRRATVLVIDANGQLYNDGQRYRKFYVPLSHLSPA